MANFGDINSEINFTASQSIRRNAADDAFEAYTPAGGGTVTSVSVVTANGVSGTVADATTTPAITLTLGAITPSSVNGVTISDLATKANAAFSGSFTLPTGLTGVIRADTGVVSTDSDVTNLVTAASDTASGIIELAIQSEMESGTDVVRAVVPGRQHFHPSAAKCWVECGVAADVTVSYNVPSTADGGAGITTVTIGTDFSSANWACVVGAQGTGTAVSAAKLCSVYTQQAGTVILSTYDLSATPLLEDCVHYYMAGFGDFA